MLTLHHRPTACWAALACGLLLAGAAPAASKVYIDRVAPLAYRVDGVQQGLLHELMTEIGQRAGHAGPITPMPLIRQRVLLSQQSDAIGTLWRLPENEEHYRWWVRLFEFSFYLVAAADSTVDISSLAAARNLRVGVILGSPAEMLARQQGFRNIQTSANAESNARKLALGRIDVWIATPLVLKTAQHGIGQPTASPRIGKQIGRVGLYLVSAPDFDVQEGEKWKAAFETMQRDGSYALIMKKYLGN